MGGSWEDVDVYDAAAAAAAVAVVAAAADDDDGDDDDDDSFKSLGDSKSNCQK
jgi:hypothetical protein